MFGIGMPEMLLILAVALIVIGPKKLPDLAKSLGKAMGEFKKATSDLKESMQIDTELKEVKTAFNEINKDYKVDPAPSDQKDKHPADDVESDNAPEQTHSGEADPMDKVKAAFDHRQAESTSDVNAPDGENGPVSGSSDPESEIGKG